MLCGSDVASVKGRGHRELLAGDASLGGPLYHGGNRRLRPPDHDLLRRVVIANPHVSNVPDQVTCALRIRRQSHHRTGFFPVAGVSHGPPSRSSNLVDLMIVQHSRSPKRYHLTEAVPEEPLCSEAKLCHGLELTD